jgi:hypothetical protein
MTADRAKAATSKRRAAAGEVPDKGVRTNGKNASRSGPTDSLAWTRFTAAVAGALSVLDAGQCLVVSGKRRSSWVHLVVGAHGGVYAEAAANAWLKTRDTLDTTRLARLRELGWAEPAATREEVEESEETLDRSSNFSRNWGGPAPLAEVAALVTATLREVYGLRRPGQLEYTAFGPGPREILLPTLGIANAPLPDEESKHTHEPELVQPESREELFAAVIEALRSYTDLDDVAVDEDGDIPLRYGSAVIFLRVGDDAPYVELFSPVLKGVEPSLELYKALNDLTGHHRQVGFFTTGGAVYASLDLIADPFVPDHLGAALAVLGRLCDDTGHDLQHRFGGSTPFEQEPRKRSKRRKDRYN